ncbi:hypothetical protein TVAG_179730 [Trichomonas vaginalis G3]|uniref:Uncharacterized protein n=1 Tax=Trichomonas vaginalis (strain ATCC PRA-98 / G3) TaxID=412133 RepID=A2F455_TRIV3|nr:hypothetical protein TVAGG3_1002260 [Trichomonas vaginalis G3]EAY00302.1 hypothetical protein TVAG_179730 [Trichomonas vaginalis G3]KAI5490875.1 hypothetical protein TVAGG3_1002260 [Trichomonas vaginalis G3]|eukprot:XP_001313231.1 hypothetical protein [Trichomonas vaginalis G3]
MKAPLSSYLFTDLKFAQFTNDLLKEFSIGNKQTKTTENPPPIRIPISSISQRVINYMYNIKLINSILAIFLSAMISLAICCCVKPSMINNTIYFDICSIIVILYFGAATASNSSINRKTGLIFAFVFGLIFFVVISYLSLGPFDIRPLILSQISIPARLVNVITSLIATYIAYSLYYPCLKLHQIYRSLITLNYDIFRWQLCQEAYNLYKPFYRTIFKSIHRLTPFLTISFIAARWYLVHIPRLDMIADISYLSLQLLISIFLFLMTKPGLRLILNDPYKYLTEFDKTRNFDHGKRFFKVLNRSLDMLPNYATALVTFPLVVAFCCVVYGISYLMSGTSQEIARVLPLFVVAVSDLAISCNKISGSFGV